jgi:cell division protein ZapA
VSNVTLTIGGRSYRVACADGQEAHVAALGAMVDEAVAASGGTRTNNEVQTLLFAALMLADDLHEARSRESGTDAALSPQVAERLDNIAARIEALAQRLEQTATNA